jgi:hypothetical protein
MEVSLNCTSSTYANHMVQKLKPTTVKNQANAVLKHVHQVLKQMLRTAEIDIAESISPNDVDVFLDNAA